MQKQFFKQPISDLQTLEPSRESLEANMGRIAKIEYFRLPPRWLFVKITDEDGNAGWGEASLEGHTQAVEGCLDAWVERYVGLEAE